MRVGRTECGFCLTERAFPASIRLTQCEPKTALYCSSGRSSLRAATGTGGTLAGVSIALNERNPDVAIALADPPGAALFNYYTSGELRAEGTSITEGIGQGRITGNLEGFAPDFSYLIPDDEALRTVFDLLEHEGLCLGPSSGVNVAGAVRLAQQLGPGHVIVTMLCDYGTRYQSKLFNADFLRSKSLPVPSWIEGRNPIVHQALEQCWTLNTTATPAA